MRAELGLPYDTAPCWIDWPMGSTEEPCRGFSQPPRRCIFGDQTCTSCWPGKEPTAAIRPSSKLLPPMDWLDRSPICLASVIDVPRLIAALDVLASSSHGEAFSNRSWARLWPRGVPCAVTDVGDSSLMSSGTPAAWSAPATWAAWPTRSTRYSKCRLRLCGRSGHEPARACRNILKSGKHSSAVRGLL